MRHALLAPLLAGILACAPAPPVQATPPVPPRAHVVVVVVDGLRADAIAAARAPNLQRLVDTGAASLRGRPVEIPQTLPGLVTLATGLPPSRHGVTWDDDRPTALHDPTVFTRVAESGGSVAWFVGKSKLRLLAGARAEEVHGPGVHNRNWQLGDGQVLARALTEQFRHEPPTLSFLHLRGPDFVGHKSGWMSPTYLEAVRSDDAALGLVLEAIEASPAAARTTVLLTADHGGEGTRHSTRGPEATWTIPWVCWTPGRAARSIAGVPTLLDVAPTVLALLELPALPGTTGKPVPECLVERGRG